MNPFALAYREQQQLFLFEKTYVLGTLLKVGGLATLLARFIVQFFWSPALAFALTLVLLILSAYMTWAYVRDSWKDWALIPLCAVPSVLIGASLSDNSLHYEFLTSIILVQAGLLIYKKVSSAKVFWGVVLAVMLYLTAGSAAILFAVCAFFERRPVVRQAHQPETKAHQPETKAHQPVIHAVIFLAAVAVCGVAAYLLSWVPTWTVAFTPAAYFDLDADLPAAHWTGWISLPVIMLICRMVARPRSGKWIAVVGGMVLLFLAIIYARKFENKMDQEEPRLAYIFEHYACNEDWDGLIKACEKAPWLPRTANYLNLALSWKGELAERLLDYDQRGPSALVMTTKDRAVDVIQAHLMLAMGNVAAAQDVAFNTIASLNGYCPAMVKINAQVELMRGSYEVADKYITLLEKAPHYRRWARSRRRFLYDDAAIEADPLLGNGRRNLAAENHFIMYSNPMSELFPILDANPTYKQTLEYGLCYLLLAKDLNSVKHYITDFYSSPDSPELPRIAQEAMVFYSEFSRNMDNVEPFGLDWCYEHGVQPEVVKSFEEYQKAAVAGNTALRRFRHTYWYYLVHTEI